MPFLAITVAAELIANDPLIDVAFNNWLYTFMGILSYAFYSYLYYRLTKNKRLKQLIYMLGLVFVGISVALIIHFESKSVTYIFLYSSIALLLFSCMYFYFTLKADYNLDDHTYVPGMWVSAGLLVFYSGVIICLSMFNYIEKNDLSIFGEKLYRLIPRVLSVILYSCFSIAFILWKKPAKTHLRQS